MLGILGKKIGMTRIFNEDGTDVGVTLIECKPNKIGRIKTEEKDGYNAVVVGIERKKPTKTKKFARAKEFKIEDIADHKAGGAVSVEIFKEVKKVKITSISKGKGFQGGIKRHNFARGLETHGSHHHREIGAIGACASPGRVHKGKKMPGRMGGAQVTLRKVEVVYLDPSKNLIGLKGAVPGPNGGTVRIEIDS